MYFEKDSVHVFENKVSLKGRVKKVIRKWPFFKITFAISKLSLYDSGHQMLLKKSNVQNGRVYMG